MGQAHRVAELVDPHGISWGIYLENDHRLRVYRDNGESLAFELVRPVIDGQWHLFDVTLAGDVVVPYVDGQPVGSGSLASSTPVPGNGLVVGGAAGDYDEAAVYGSALTGDRVDAHWTRGRSSTASCLERPVALAPDAPADAPVPSAYGVEVGTDNPTVYLRLGEVATDPAARVAFDSSGACLNAAVATGATAAVNGAVLEEHGPGDTDAAVTAPVGVPAVVGSDAALPGGNADRTLEVWARSPGVGNWIIRYGQQWGLYRESGTRLRVYRDNGDSFPVDLNVAVDDNQWHLFDLSLAAGVASVFVDGQDVGHGDLVSATPVPGSGLIVGGLAGDYDEAAAYPVALSPSQIANRFHQGLLADTSVTLTSTDATWLRGRHGWRGRERLGGARRSTSSSRSSRILGG